jgi:DNA glycosylase AlkZ-like
VARRDLTLGRRALNRATLARQCLLERSSAPLVDLVEHLVGLQAQSPTAPHLGLWSRLDAFRPSELDDLLVDRHLVRIVLMRGTIHLVSAEDCRQLRPVFQPILDQDVRTNRDVAPHVDGVDLVALREAARAIVEDEPCTPAELGRELGRQWPDRNQRALAYAARDLLPLVQVPPRGLWHGRGATRHTTADAWLGRPLATKASVERVVLRYLAAFGPASVADAQTWAGLRGFREVVDRLRPELRTFRSEAGMELFDLPDAPRPPAESPAPARLVAPFDNLLLSHADRSRVVDDDARKQIVSKNGIVSGTVLVDGFVAGIWKLARGRPAASVEITAFRRLAAGEHAAVEAEAHRLESLASA